MNPNDPNVAMVEIVAARLGALRERVVFVGGCAAGLLITDPALPAIRATGDVDVVVEVATLADYHRLEKKVAGAGFQRDVREGAPICRWRLGEAVLDRGADDFLMSHDLGDALAVIDGRDQLVSEFARMDAELTRFVRETFAKLLATPRFGNYLPGHLPGDEASQARLPLLDAKLAQLAALARSSPSS